MGTSGFVGFVVDGVEKIVVTGTDSYPSVVGVDVLAWLRKNQDDLVLAAPGGVLARVRALSFIPDSYVYEHEEDPPGLDRVRTALLDGPHADFAEASVEEVLQFAAHDVDTLLRGGLAFDGTTFPLNSLFCEWGYLIDLDTRMFEVYRGLQETPPTAGRFVGRPPVRDGYFPVAMVASWPFVALPDRDGFMALPDAY